MIISNFNMDFLMRDIEEFWLSSREPWIVSGGAINDVSLLYEANIYLLVKLNNKFSFYIIKIEWHSVEQNDLCWYEF